jgi:MFS family permease
VNPLAGHIRGRRTTFALLCGLSFLLYVDRVSLSTAAVPMQTDLGLSNVQLGLVFSAFAYSYFLTQVLGGVIADRFGPRWTITGCVGIWVVTTACMGLVGGLASLLAVRLALGFGEGAALPGATRAINNWFDSRSRGLVQGVTHSFSRLGNALTPPIVAFLVIAFGWRASFGILALATLVWLIGWSFWFSDGPADATPNGETRRDRPAPTPWLPLLRRVAPTCAVYFCYGWTGWLYFTWLPTFFMHAHQLDIKSSALFSSGVFFAGVVGDGLGGIVADQIFRRTGSLAFSRSLMIAGSFMASAACLAPALVSHDLTVITLSLSAAFFFIEMSVGPIWLVPMDVAPAHCGTAGGLINAGSALAGIISPILFGEIIDRTGNWTAPFIGSVVLLLFGAGLAFWIKPDLQIDRLGTLRREPRAGPEGSGNAMQAAGSQ